MCQILQRNMVIARCGEVSVFVGVSSLTSGRVCHGLFLFRWRCV
ncbi:MAG: hypothetical protein FD153_946 [Rhodospirillaceae bacterium]|nr:MAG: hypothetical protein FD153_946 [Rhodospirillaceae bacterium]